MKDTNNEYESAKELLESVGMRIDERTSISDRNGDRFSTKPISSATRKIKQRAVDFYSLMTGQKGFCPEIDGKIYYGGSQEGGLDFAHGLKFSYEDASFSREGNTLTLEGLEFAVLSDKGIVNNPEILRKFESSVRKLGYDRSQKSFLGGWVELYIETLRVDKSDLSVWTDVRIKFPVLDKDSIDYTDSVKILSERSSLLKDVQAYLDSILDKIQDLANKWDKSYERTWGKNESIPYADLPWAEKQQNTITEQKMQKLFPDGRLSDAMERLFEGASCIGTGYKYEEDYLKKEDEKE